MSLVIGMRNRELIKSTILIILVLISVFMTYRIWTFTPELTDLETDVNTETPSIGPKISKPIDSVIMPFRMINRNGTDVKGTSNVKDIKKITDQLLSKEVKKVDILVHPSRFEGKSNTIDEALYYTTPVVATNFETVFELCFQRDKN